MGAGSAFAFLKYIDESEYNQFAVEILSREGLEKSKMMTALGNKLNSRQEKALLRMFAEGLSGFKGGLSAENYIAITKTSRATATRDLNELILLKALKKTGELRHTRYWLNLSTIDIFSEMN